MKQILTTLFVIFICTPGNGQTTTSSKPNAISFELGKNGLIYNLSFDHKLATGNMGFRVSAGSNLAKYLNAVTVGGGGYYLIGKTTRLLELGMDLHYLIVDEVSDDQKGFTFIYPRYSIRTFYPSLNLGYRAYGKNNLFRIGLSPGLIGSEVVPGAYIGFGRRF